MRYNSPCVCGRSSSGRARPCQGRGSEFEPRRPLQKKKDTHTGVFLFLERRFCAAKSVACGRVIEREWGNPSKVSPSHSPFLAVGGSALICLRRGYFLFLAKEGVPRSGAGHFPYLPPAASFLSAAKEKRKRNAAKNYVFGFPCAALPAAYPACFHHANVVPHKFRLNIALSLLLGALPLLL